MIDIANDVQSMSHFKRNTAKIVTKLKKSKRPMVLTVNGKARVVVQDAASYQQLLEQAHKAEKAEMLAFLKESLADSDAGRTVPAKDFIENLGRRS